MGTRGSREKKRKKEQRVGTHLGTGTGGQGGKDLEGYIRDYDGGSGST